ncbi:MAG TPA: hypothetical protein VGK22_15965 [Candidatus Angelobacter sp.]
MAIVKKEKELPKQDTTAYRPSSWPAVFEKIADKFGIPTAFGVMSFVAVSMWATTEQKRAIIDMYVLGRGVDQIYPIVIFSVIAVVLSFCQNRYFRRQLRLKDDEIARLAEYKSEHQQSQIDKRLHHTKKG